MVILNNNDDLFNLTQKTYSKSIAADIDPIKFEEIGTKIKELMEKLTNGKYTTNGESGLDGYPITVYKKNE